ncbi:MAG: hypothetical protein ABL964_04610 [Steroidobacteraceae bacterium]
MLRPVLTIAALTLLGGCATSSGQPDAPQSRAAGNDVTINCSGANSDWVFCYRNANEVCGLSGFTVVTRDGAIGAAASSNDRRLIVRCK